MATTNNIRTIIKKDVLPLVKVEFPEGKFNKIGMGFDDLLNNDTFPCAFLTEVNSDVTVNSVGNTSSKYFVELDILNLDKRNEGVEALEADRDEVLQQSELTCKNFLKKLYCNEKVELIENVRLEQRIQFLTDSAYGHTITFQVTLIE